MCLSDFYLGWSNNKHYPVSSLLQYKTFSSYFPWQKFVWGYVLLYFSSFEPCPSSYATLYMMAISFIYEKKTIWNWKESHCHVFLTPWYIVPPSYGISPLLMSLNSCQVVQLLWNIEPSHDRPSAHSILTPYSWDITIQIPFSNPLFLYCWPIARTTVCQPPLPMVFWNPPPPQSSWNIKSSCHIWI